MKNDTLKIEVVAAMHEVCSGYITEETFDQICEGQDFNDVISEELGIDTPSETWVCPDPMFLKLGNSWEDVDMSDAEIAKTFKIEFNGQPVSVSRKNVVVIPLVLEEGEEDEELDETKMVRIEDTREFFPSEEAYNEILSIYEHHLEAYEDIQEIVSEGANMYFTHNYSESVSIITELFDEKLDPEKVRIVLFATSNVAPWADKLDNVTGENTEISLCPFGLYIASILYDEEDIEPSGYSIKDVEEMDKIVVEYHVEENPICCVR